MFSYYLTIYVQPSFKDTKIKEMHIRVSEIFI